VTSVDFPTDGGVRTSGQCGGGGTTSVGAETVESVRDVALCTAGLTNFTRVTHAITGDCVEEKVRKKQIRG
jgi:hypothetical protein